MTVAIGFFDGVHLGHQAILKGADVALTFENHPLSFLAPARAPRLIMSWNERARTMMDLGVHVCAIDFDADIANWTPERFVEMLKGYADGWADLWHLPREPLTIRCGDNWRFGKGGVGTAAWLNAHGLPTTVVPYAAFKGEPISSTRIRQALEAGAIADANAMMGRALKIKGTRFKGKGAGRELGYPTINIKPAELNLKLPLGVYEVEFAGVTAIANYGLAPTFDAAAWQEPVWEIHCLELPENPDVLTADENPSFALVEFIRPERKFASPEELKRQIAADISSCASLDFRAIVW